MRREVPVLFACWWFQRSHAFQPSIRSSTSSILPLAAHNKKNPLGGNRFFQTPGVLENELHPFPKSAFVAAIALLGTPTPALAATGSSVPSAFLAWLHFVGILGVAGGLIAERFLIRPGLSLEDEIRINNADGIYGLSAFSLLISGYFRATQFEKGWDYYRNEPIFWLKMSAVAILGGLSLFPAMVFFRRDLARQKGQTLPPLSDDILERITQIINAEILALLSIPLLASLMARGVLYTPDFPWPLGVGLYVVCLGGAGYKYGTEAFQRMEQEGALVPVETELDDKK